MITEAQWTEAVALLPFLAHPDAAITRAFRHEAMLMRLPEGVTIFSEGDACTSFSILLSGQVRVFKIGETGRELTLYRLARGESCILTASCLLSERQFPAIATVEQVVEAFVIPQTSFQGWMDTYPAWRAYVFQLIAQRLSTVMAVVDEIAFRRLDVRIAQFLLRGSDPRQATLNLTHQQIAVELGTSREVVSRILADFVDDRMVRVARGSVTILDRQALAERAEAN
ncbi:Crp/Fnr family transcriptional regulator [Candidatus Chloroploca sp. Khr17]|uniref:Crp/Fnr family transcriptional regulator n=1 Tax=Candidatus Chloroploca sp. Khr17 TaxID=2496869 RepID=UPI00101DEFF2|nr:Crp/Fnr family transcriptional regulator [Candidatus Chloroploca sp. Khr17]